MTAALRLAPQYAIKRISSSAHSTVHFATSQGERTTRMPTAGPAGPGSPFGPGGPGGPGSPLGPSLRPQLITAPARTIAVTAHNTRMAMLWLNRLAHRQQRTVRRPGGATRRGALGWHDGGVSFRPTIGG